MADDTPKDPEFEKYEIVTQSNLFDTTQLETSTSERSGIRTTPRSREQQAEWEQDQAKVVDPRYAEEGWTVAVPPESVWQQTVPPVTHWPLVWIDVYTGESLNKSRQPWGKAQQYGSGTLSGVRFDEEDFIRLADVQGVRVRLTSHAGSGGTCTVTLKNALIRKASGKGDGSWIWERRQFKSGRFTDGQRIRYLHDVEGSTRLWYSGKLKKHAMGSVKLDGTYYMVNWDDGIEPYVLRLNPDHFFAEDMGEPLFEPMQKLKIFAVNRFTPEVLKDYNYSMYEGPGVAGEVPAPYNPNRWYPYRTRAGDAAIWRRCLLFCNSNFHRVC